MSLSMAERRLDVLELKLRPLFLWYSMMAEAGGPAHRAIPPGMAAGDCINAVRTILNRLSIDDGEMIRQIQDLVFRFYNRDKERLERLEQFRLDFDRLRRHSLEVSLKGLDEIRERLDRE